MSGNNFRTHNQSNTFSLLNFTINHSFGLVKNETHANMLLIVVTLILIATSAVIYNSTRIKVIDGGPGPSQEELLEYSKMQ